MSTTAPATSETGARAAWEEWRAERRAVLAEPHGWLSLTALHWLSEEEAAHGDVPGRWRVRPGDGAVVVRADAGEDLRDGDVPVDGELVLHPVDGEPGPRLRAGEREVEVLRRGEGAALRVRDPRSPVLAAFSGVPVFDHDPSWVRPGRFVPAAAPRDVVVGAVVAGLTHTRTSPGQVEFVHDGRPVRLTAFADGDDLVVLFSDATSGVTTTPAVRSLRIAAPAADGSVVLDLNRAANLPCAFTDHATCPLPPAENRLPFPVEAGERDPR